MKKIFLLIGICISVICFGQKPERTLKIVTFEGTGYELGLQHGKALKPEIKKILKAWRKNASAVLGKSADEVLKDFYQYAHFEESIKKWTPGLYDEVRGIAEGSGQDFKDILILNLLDEFWVYINYLHNINKHHCSALGVPSKPNQAGYISQNMDLSGYTDGFQVLMRLKKTESSPEQLILTYPGLVALNGLNENGIGVVVNTLMQLKASPTGLPVAFVIRKLIGSTDKEAMLKFITSVKHASGQNYILGIKGEVFDFEASTNKVIQFDPKNENGSVYHTNHPLINDDIKPWFSSYNPGNTSTPKGNSYYRFKTVESTIANASGIDDRLIEQTLQSKANQENPVCRTNNYDGSVFTFASVVMAMADAPYLLITSGPPDESDYQKFGFTD